MHLCSLGDSISFLFTHALLFLLLTFPSILPPFSLRRQTKPRSKFIIYLVTLKFMVLKGWIRLATSTLSLVWVLRETEIVSQIGLITFGPGDAWGFILLPRNCFVCISRQRLADILNCCYSSCLFQVVGVISFCVCSSSENEHKAILVTTETLVYTTSDGACTHVLSPRPKESS